MQQVPAGVPPGVPPSELQGTRTVHAPPPPAAATHTHSKARLLCKYNLHQLVCRLVAQAKERGHSANNTEFW